MASKSLTFDIFGRDRGASKAIDGVSNTAYNAGKMIGNAGKAIGVGLGIATVAAVAFGKESVEAFAEAQAAQNKLTFAYEKFPALADVNISAMRKLNEERAKTTRYDDDVTASSQAVLAQFGLTGKQIIKLTPLMQDYAARTGKDLPTAAEDLGKALLGQGRALKAIGIEFTDTGTLAGNFDKLVGDLGTTVGGFAEKDGLTAAGKLEILKNRFGELQETIGAALIPALGTLMDTFESKVMPKLEDFANWFATDGVVAIDGFASWFDSDVMPKLDGFIGWLNDGTDKAPLLIGGIGGLTVAAWGLSAAMSANPLGVFIWALGISIALTTTFWGVMTGAIGDIGLAWQLMAAGFVANLNTMIGAINLFLTPLNNLINSINTVTGLKIGNLRIAPLNYNIDVAGSKTGQAMAASTPSGGRTGGRAMLASGGIVPAIPGGLDATIGEGGVPEAVIPLTAQNMAAMGGGGTTVNVYVDGNMLGTEASMAKWMKQVWTTGVKQGAVPAGSLG